MLADDTKLASKDSIGSTKNSHRNHKENE